MVKMWSDRVDFCWLSQSSTVRRCPRGETVPRLCRIHSEASTTLPQHDQWGLPGCPLWPCPQPWNPPMCTHTNKCMPFILNKLILDANNFLCYITWHGPCAATACLFSSPTRAEGTAMEYATVTPKLPLHI